MSRQIVPKTSVTLSVAEKTLRQTDTGKMLFTDYRGRKCMMYLQNDRLIQVKVLDGNSGKIGAVYVGKIKNIAKNINACFVEIENGEICYLSMKDVSVPYLLNRTYDERLIEGDELLVQVIRDAQKTKQASVTTNISGVEEEILQKALHRTCFSCVKEAPGQMELLLNEYASDTCMEILTDLPDCYEQLQNICHKNQFKVPVRLYQDKQLSLSAVYGIQSKMDIALERRIWLKSGAYLVIEPTEAMTVIDVNTGKFDAKKDTEETFRRINWEAAEEIAIQLKLRNLSGIIIVDFINMKSKEDRRELLNYMKDLTVSDSVKTTIVDMTPLGLVEITRKKVNKPLWEQLRF